MTAGLSTLLTAPIRIARCCTLHSSQQYERLLSPRPEFIQLNLLSLSVEQEKQTGGALNSLQFASASECGCKSPYKGTHRRLSVYGSTRRKASIGYFLSPSTMALRSSSTFLNAFFLTHYRASSEVATTDFLKRNGMPVPRVYNWSPSNYNPTGVAYIITENAAEQR